MSTTRSGVMVSAQIAKMGAITGLQDKDFSLPDGSFFNIKNDGIRPVTLQVQLQGMPKGETIETTFDVGWNPEIVKVVKQTSIVNLNLKWGY